MMRNFRVVPIVLTAALLAACQTATPDPVAQQAGGELAAESSLWDRGNIVAWSVGPYDAEDRNPEQRAEMLQRLGIKRYAYYWIPADIPEFDAEISAMKAHDIEFQGWWIPFAPDDPLLAHTLELFGRHEVKPHLWYFPPIPTYAEISEITGGAFPANFDELPMEERVTFYPILSATLKQIEQDRWPRTPDQYRARVESEAARIAAVAAQADDYGITVDIYSHVHWLGVPEHAADVVELLRSRGVANVGIVYNFNHARGVDRDDTANFEEVWAKIQPFVSSVNVAGTHMEDGTALLPGQGDSELEMMQVIEESGWRGPVGVNAETGGDARVTLTTALEGMERLAAELAESSQR